MKQSNLVRFLCLNSFQVFEKVHKNQKMKKLEKKLPKSPLKNAVFCGGFWISKQKLFIHTVFVFLIFFLSVYKKLNFFFFIHVHVDVSFPFVELERAKDFFLVRLLHFRENKNKASVEKKQNTKNFIWKKSVFFSSCWKPSVYSNRVLEALLIFGPTKGFWNLLLFFFSRTGECILCLTSFFLPFVFVVFLLNGFH